MGQSKVLLHSPWLDGADGIAEHQLPVWFVSSGSPFYTPVRLLSLMVSVL